MKHYKIIALILTCIIFSGSLCANASVYLEDFTGQNRHFELNSAAVPAEIRDGKFVFDYTDVAAASDANVSRRLTHRWVVAKESLYIEFDFEVSEPKMSWIELVFNQYGSGYSTPVPFRLSDKKVSIPSAGKSVDYSATSGTVAVLAEMTADSAAEITTWLNGEQIDKWTQNRFTISPDDWEFQYRIVTGANVPYGQDGPVISIDNIKTVIDEDIPSLYAAEEQMLFDFGDNRFLASENTFPYYKVKSVRQIANFTREPQTFTSIIAIRGRELDDLNTHTITLSPGEVREVTLAAESDGVQSGKVSAYVWRSLSSAAPLIKAFDVVPAPVRADTPDDIAKRLANISGTHPRLLTNVSLLANTEGYIGSDAIYASLQEALRSWSTTHNSGNFLTCTFPPYDAGRMPSNLPDIMATRAKVWGYLYQVTGDENYAQMLMDDMVTLAGYGSWYHNDSFLNTAAIASAMAIGYDFIYDYLCKEENKANAKLITDAIYKKGILKALEHYRADETDDWHRRITNWNMICNGGIGAACMAIGDLEEYRQECAIALNYILRYIRYPIEHNDDGAFVEGPSYFAYMMSHGAEFLTSLSNTFGDDFGYYNYESLRSMAYDPVKLSGSLYSFAYAAAYPNVTNEKPFLSFFGKYLNMQELGHFRYKQLENAVQSGKLAGNYDVLDIIWYDPSFMRTPANAGKSGYDAIYGIPTDTYYKGTGIVAFHDDYSQNQAFVAADFGKNNETGSHADMGNFVYEANGEQWFIELGTNDYSKKIYYDKLYYRAKPEGHNCVVINPDDSVYIGQSANAEGKAEKVQHGEDVSYAVMDISSAYEADATSFKRLVYFDKTTKGLGIKDKFSLKGDDNEYYWFAHTGADIELSDDGKSAILEQNGKKLKVAILGDNDSKFEIMEAERLYSIPNDKLDDNHKLDEDPENTGIQKLAIHKTGMKGDCEITVVMAPADSDGSAALPEDISNVDF